MRWHQSFSISANQYLKSMLHRKLVRNSILLGSLLLVGFALYAGMPPVPVAEVIPEYEIHFGDTLVDNYRWMETRETEEILSYLFAENEYTEAMMRHTLPLQDSLFNEISQRNKWTDLSVPTLEDGWYYYSRTEEEFEYPFYCRRRAEEGAEEQVYLNQNELAEGYDYHELGVFETSPDHSLLAFSEDMDGSEVFTLRIKNLDTGEYYPEVIPNTDWPAAWSADSRTLYYCTLDDNNRADRLWSHELGSDPDNDTELLYEPDKRFPIYVSRTKDERYIVVYCSSKMSSEVYYMDTTDPEATLHSFQPREHGIDYDWFEHRDGFFYALTNMDAINYRLIRTPVNATSPENWEEIIPGRDEVMLEDFEMFQNYMVVQERENGVRRIRIHSFETGEDHFIAFDEPAYLVEYYVNPEFDSDSLRISYESYVTPETIYDYNMRDRTMIERKKDVVGGGYNPEEFQMTVLMVPARDGEEVPLTLFHRRGIELDGTNPMLFEGYGAYGDVDDPYFSTYKLTLVNHGLIYGFAHLRGSAAKGQQWYEDGKFLNKMNTFYDYIDCAEYLIEEGYTSQERLIGVGRSAGGLLVGAVVNMRPDLFQAIIADVPFVDLMNTMLDSTVNLTVGEWEEWGNPNYEEFYHYMRSYSPYDNVTDQDYPNMLILAGYNDPRVGYWEAAKWCASLRVHNTSDNTILFSTNMGAGHGGASGRYDYLGELVFEIAYIMDVLGIEYSE